MKELFCEVCGCKELVERDGVFVCKQCGAEYTPEELKQVLGELPTEEELQEAGLTQEDPESEGRKRPSGRGVFSIVLAVLALLLAVAAAGYAYYQSAMVPKRQYERALANLEAGKYDDAIRGFWALDGYEDSARRALDAEYARANALLQKGEFDGAALAFDALGDFQDSASLAGAARYQKAVALLETGHYEEARLAFRTLGDDVDTADMLRRCALEEGKLLFEQGAYEDAIRMLAPYAAEEEAHRYIVDSVCKAQLTYEHFESRTMEYLADFSPEQLHDLGRHALQLGDYAAAAACFKSCIRYEDSLELYKQTTLQAWLRTDYETPRAQAEALYAVALGDSLKDIRPWLTRSERRYDPARALLDQLADGCYQAAQAAFERTDYGTAREQLQVIEGMDYKEADALLADCQSRIAAEMAVYNGVWRERSYRGINVKIQDGQVYICEDQTDELPKNWRQMESVYDADTGALSFVCEGYRYDAVVYGTRLTVQLTNQEEAGQGDPFGANNRLDRYPAWEQ